MKKNPKTIPVPSLKRRDVSPDLSEIIKRLEDLGKRVELLELVLITRAYKHKDKFDYYVCKKCGNEGGLFTKKEIKNVTVSDGKITCTKCGNQLEEIGYRLKPIYDAIFNLETSFILLNN